MDCCLHACMGVEPKQCCALSAIPVDLVSIVWGGGGGAQTACQLPQSRYAWVSRQQSGTGTGTGNGTAGTGVCKSDECTTLIAADRKTSVNLDVISAGKLPDFDWLLESCFGVRPRTHPTTILITVYRRKVLRVIRGLIQESS